MNFSSIMRTALAALATLPLIAMGMPLVQSPTIPQFASVGAGGDCHNPGISADGRFVVFVSSVENLVTNDNNGAFDVFVRDRLLAKTILVSTDAAGASSANGASIAASISANGRFVVFESTASNLVTNDNNQVADVFLRDLQAGTTTLLSVNTLGTLPGNLESTSPAITPDGRYVLFCSRASTLASGDANSAVDLFVRDISSGTTTLASRSYLKTTSHTGSQAVWSGPRQISDDGRRIAFDSTAVNVVASDTNAKMDVFVADLAGSNILVSVSSAGTGFGNGTSQSPSMEATGRYVAFQSASSNIATNDTGLNLNVFRRDLLDRTTTLVSVNTNGVASSSGISTSPVLSRQGNAILFLSTANDLVQNDTNTVGADLFLRDFTSKKTTPVDVRAGMATTPTPIASFTPGISADGRFVLYLDSSRTLVIFDASTGGRTTLATNATGSDAVMTDDASFITFVGQSDQAGVRNIFLHDRLGRTTELVSRSVATLSAAAGAGISRVIPGGISSNGQFIVFESQGCNWAANDTNGTRDVFICDLNDRAAGPLRLGGIIPGLSAGPLRRPVISPDARWIVFEGIPDSTPVASLASRFSLYAFDRISRTNLPVGGVGSVLAASNPSLSQQGSTIAFQSSESGVGGYATTVGQIYYRDLTRSTNRLISLDPAKTTPGNARSSEPSISPNGRYVAYLSAAGNLLTTTISGINAYLWDSVGGSNILISTSAGGAALGQVTQVAFRSNGSLISFQQGSTNYIYSITNRAILSTLTDAANISMSADGRFVACERNASYATIDTNSSTDIYVIDRTTGQSTLVSVNSRGTGSGKGRSTAPVLSSDGRYVVFRSRATDLVSNDTNAASDVFLRDLVLKRTILLSSARDGFGTGNKLSTNPMMSADGSTILFESDASDLVTDDANGSRDTWLLRLTHGDTDSDGLPDDWELAYFNTLGRDGTGDYDGDGQSDRAEWLSGTDPTNASSVLHVLTLSAPGGGPVRAYWSSEPGKTYRLQYLNSVSDSDWKDVPGDIVATGSTCFKDDPSNGATQQRYYRVRLIP